MSQAAFVLSTFGDEISSDFKEQMVVLQNLNIGYLDLRGAWDKNVLQFDDNEIVKVGRICKEYDIEISCIGSPIGKSPITSPLEEELSKLNRIFRIAEHVGTRRIRIFSFYPPDTKNNMRYDLYVKEATERLAYMADLAKREGFYLLLENEKEIVGDIPERCYYILHDINNSHLRFTWDPANFVQVGVGRVTERAWPLLGQYTAYVHIKDALLIDGTVKAAGEGDGQVKEFLIKLRDRGYQGFLSLEPHLGSGSKNTAYAAKALRKILTQLGCVESKTFKNA
jgi:sugar phosphate isomerase/epimerase